jgi:hypothetical protein
MGTMATRALRARTVVLALATVLALLVAPVCAPLCAARTCNSGAGHEQCRDMAGMSAGGSDHLVAPSKVCAAFDSSAVLGKASEEFLLSKVDGNHSARLAMSGLSTQSLGGLIATSRRWDEHRVPIGLADSLLLSAVLRI